MFESETRTPSRGQPIVANFMRQMPSQKHARVNAKDVEYVECEHVNKTEIMLQLETQIHEYTSQLDVIEKD